MTTSLNISVTDNASPAVRGIISRLRHAALAGAFGPGMVNLVQANYLKLPPNRLGGKRYFWSGAAKATSYQPGEDGVVITTAQIGVRQRFLGGIIRPVNKKYLTLPANNEAYGHTASEFKLKFAIVDGRPALVKTGATATNIERKKRGKGFKATSQNIGQVVMFWLARKVKQLANRAVLPSDAEFAAVADRAIENLLHVKGQTT